MNKILKINITLFIIFALLLVFYVYFVVSTVAKASDVKELSREIANKNAQLSEIEFEYMRNFQQLSKDDAKKFGLVSINEKTYLKTKVHLGLGN